MATNQAASLTSTATTGNVKSIEKRWSITPDPMKPGFLQKCYSTPDTSAQNAERKAGIFSAGNDAVRNMSSMKGPGGTQKPRVCPRPETYYTEDNLMKMWDGAGKGGVASNTLIPDDETGRVAPSQVASHVNSLQTSGVLLPIPTMKVGDDNVVDMNTYIRNDSALYTALQDEYCYYFGRYQYSLRRFFSLATSRNTADNPEAERMLSFSRLLNIRVNSVLEVMNYLTQQRIPRVNKSKSDIDKGNRSINERLAQMNNAWRKLQEDDLAVKTQREMIRYTSEKNTYSTNQLNLWITMNIIGLTAIFYVYRS
jgi:hypothetical protein